MYHWFKPAGAGACSLNVALITLALLVVVALSVLSLHPVCKKGSIFPSAVIALYCMYLCFSSLQSEPKDYQCNGLAQKITAASGEGGSSAQAVCCWMPQLPLSPRTPPPPNTLSSHPPSTHTHCMRAGSTLALGMLVTLAAVVYAAFRAGSNTSLFTLDSSVDGGDMEEQRMALLTDQGLTATSAGLDGGSLAAPGEQEAQRLAAEKLPGAGGAAIDEFAPVTYNYSFFHLIFALASMYIAMLMTGWGSSVQVRGCSRGVWRRRGEQGGSACLRLGGEPVLTRARSHLLT